jgi:site-specific recombinase XerD
MTVTDSRSSFWKSIAGAFPQRQGVLLMKVQRVRLSDPDRYRWLVLDDGFTPIQPILVYLTFLDDLDRSPNTVRATAQHLKLFWEFLRDEQLSWTEVDVTHMAAFIRWLRRPEPSTISIHPQKAARTNATIDQILTSVHGFYDYHMKIKSVPDLPLYRFLMLPQRHYKPFLHGIAKDKPIRTRVVAVKREERRPRTLSCEQVQELLDACTRTRDKFLLALLYETGMRIGQALGLRHADLSVEDGEIHIVPRDDNANGARAKTRTAYTIPAMPSLMQLYTDYLISDLGALEADSLPDYVFVNLWEGEIGRPMTYDSVRSLVHRLCKKTGIAFIMRDKPRQVNPPAKQSQLFGVAPVGYNAALDLSHTALRAESEGERYTGVLPRPTLAFALRV